jgi:hypothetical protein
MPRHEIKPERKKEAISSFERHEGSLLRRSEPVRNPTRWSGARMVAVDGAVSKAEMDRRKDTLTNEIKALGRVANFERVGSREAKWAGPWKERAQKARGDLPGYWNDFKQQMAERAAFSKDPVLMRTLDWLELAEQRGGIGTRLEQWKDISTQDWNFYDLPTCAQEIRKGIEFCRETIKEGFGNSVGLSEQQIASRNDLLFALDSIAAEIIRQSELSLNGKQYHLGEAFDAMKVRLVELSARASARDRTRTAIERNQLDTKWQEIMPRAGQIATADRLTDALSDWQDSISALKDAARIDSGDGHAALARDVATATNVLTDRLVDAENDAMANQGFDPDDFSLAIYAYWSIGAEIKAFQDRLANHLGPDARSALTVASSKIGQALQQFKERKKSVYLSCLDYAAVGKLDVFWKDARTYTDKQVRAGDAGLADLLSQRLGNELESMLEAWKKREPASESLTSEEVKGICKQYPDLAAKLRERHGVSPEEAISSPEDLPQASKADAKFLINAVMVKTTYLLGWKMTSTIRSIRERVELTLKSSPKDLPFVINSLDAMATMIVGEVERVAEFTEADVLD